MNKVISTEAERIERIKRELQEMSDRPNWDPVVRLKKEQLKNITLTAENKALEAEAADLNKLLECAYAERDTARSLADDLRAENKKFRKTLDAVWDAIVR